VQRHSVRFFGIWILPFRPAIRPESGSRDAGQCYMAGSRPQRRAP
jgi:hypothetical protein